MKTNKMKTVIIEQQSRSKNEKSEVLSFKLKENKLTWWGTESSVTDAAGSRETSKI